MLSTIKLTPQSSSSPSSQHSSQSQHLPILDSYLRHTHSSSSSLQSLRPQSISSSSAYPPSSASSAKLTLDSDIDLKTASFRRKPAPIIGRTIPGARTKKRGRSGNKLTQKPPHFLSQTYLTPSEIACLILAMSLALTILTLTRQPGPILHPMKELTSHTHPITQTPHCSITREP